MTCVVCGREFHSYGRVSDTCGPCEVALRVEISRGWPVWERFLDRHRAFMEWCERRVA